MTIQAPLAAGGVVRESLVGHFRVNLLQCFEAACLRSEGVEGGPSDGKLGGRQHFRPIADENG